MQISALEVAKLLSIENAGLSKTKRPQIDFVQIDLESLPKSVQPEAAEVERVVEMVKAAPDVREDIVMRLKERIEKGEYNVSGEEIAEMMIRRMRADSVR
jgi:negative regulator of flagellin synthesis FlgM